MPHTGQDEEMDRCERGSRASRRARAYVLDAFMEQCFCPTPEDLARWQARHPEHASALGEAACETVAIRVMTGVFRREDAPGPTRQDVEREMRIVSAGFGKQMQPTKARGLVRRGEP